MKRCSLSPHPDLDRYIDQMASAVSLSDVSAIRKRLIKKLKTKPDSCNKCSYIYVSNRLYMLFLIKNDCFV